jgi:hypothetical protein
MNIHAARYRNALRKAASINRYIKKGYHVLHGDTPLKDGAKFVMMGDELCLKCSNSFYVLYYQNDKNYDHGYWTPIKEWNKEFTDSFTVYEPSAKVRL